jgi:hypothetical protein
MLMITAANRLIRPRRPTDPQMVARAHGPAADLLVAARLASDPAEAASPLEKTRFWTGLEWLFERATGCHPRQDDWKWARKRD